MLSLYYYQTSEFTEDHDHFPKKNKVEDDVPSEIYKMRAVKEIETAAVSRISADVARKLLVPTEWFT